MGNSGRRVGSFSLLQGGGGRDSVVSELLVASLGLDGMEKKSGYSIQPQWADLDSYRTVG